MEIGGEDFLIFHFVVAQVMCAFLSHSVSLFLFFALAFCADWKAQSSSTYPPRPTIFKL